MSRRRTLEGSRPRRRGCVAVIAALAVLVVVVEIAGTYGGSIGFSGSESVGGAPAVSQRPDSLNSISGSQIAAAEGSLELGAGPAGGVALNCSGDAIAGDGVGCDTALSQSTSQPLVTTDWSEVSHPPPAAREHSMMVYDAHDGYVLLFGGLGVSSSYLGDTWKFAAGIWTELHPSTAPSAREDSAIAYDAKDGYVVLFGGANLSGFLSDTWKFAGGAWSELAPVAHPPALAVAAMTYDATDGYVVLFGGINATFAVQAGTWKFVGGAWTDLSPLTPSPASRYGENLGYDASDGYVVLFGGYNSNGTALGDTWSFAADAWTNLALTTHPSPRGGSAVAYSVKDGKLILFGGTSGNSDFSDTWTFTGGLWTRISTAFNPSKRSEFIMASGTTTANVVLFGGQTSAGVLLNDTWELHGLVWAQAAPRNPAPRVSIAMTYDESDGYVLLFGGHSSTGGTLGDTWKFQNGVWTPLYPAVSPPARYFGGMVYDQADGYVLLYGGATSTGLLSDTWSFHAGNWTQVASSSGPPGRMEFGMAYDASDGYVLLFGGYNETTTRLYSDTWSYSAGIWSKLSPTKSPSGRFGAQMTYDSEDGYVLLFSGGNYTIPKGLVLTPADTWTFHAGQWTNITSTLSGLPPVGIFFGGLVDDTWVGCPILFGGLSYPSITLTDLTYCFTGSGWTQLQTTENPGAIEEFGMAYNPPDNEVVLFGGAPSSTVPLSSTWVT